MVLASQMWRLPSIHWPSELREAGPVEDPAIVLVGAARIAGVCFNIVALRMSADLRVPDFLSKLPQHVYDDVPSEMIDEIEELSGSIDPGRIEINGSQYLLWMVPAARKLSDLFDG